MMLPDPPPSLAPEAAAAAAGAGAGLGNPITAVLISYRSFDTMLEKVVLILAVVGVWSVGTDKAWGDTPAPFRRPKPYAPMVFLAQMLAPIGGIIGIHIFSISLDLQMAVKECASDQKSVLINVFTIVNHKNRQKIRQSSYVE